uniref:hypothetical protein n=1 Tax=Methylobacterium sp. Leaf118 TaxID=2876562 RepID=UPI001E4F100D
VRRIEEAVRDHADSAHCVLLITHEGLFLLGPEKLAGWHVRIDEVPDGAVLTSAFPATISFLALSTLYDLEPTGHDNWHQVVPRPGVDPVKPSEYRTDAAGPLAAFHKATTNSYRAVFVDLSAWEDARAHGRQVHWWSIWTPTSLRCCTSVAITGAGFFRSMLYHACVFIHGDELAFERLDPPTLAPRAKPRVTIRYFARHPGSTMWWQTDDGSLCLVRVSEHLQQIGFKGYWSSNHEAKAYFRHRFGGDAVEPRQAGTNALRRHTACAFVYSNKAQPAERPLLELLNLDEGTVSVAREQEDIIQFVMRGAIRDPRFEGSYDVYLYSQDQAEALATYLVREGITVEERVEVIPVAEAGIMEVARPEPKGRYTTMTPAADEATASEREEQKLAKDRERKKRQRAASRAEEKANGSYRGRGRPRKVKFQP